LTNKHLYYFFQEKTSPTKFVNREYGDKSGNYIVASANHGKHERSIGFKTNDFEQNRSII